MRLLITSMVGSGLAIMLACAALGQVTSQAGQGAPPQRAANAWIKTPTPYFARFVGVSLETRASRDEYWDNSQIAPRKPLALTPNIVTGISEGSYGAEPPEIPELPNRAIVIATFTTPRSVMTASGRAIYTEMTFRVNQVVEDRSGHAPAGSEITVLVAGGTVVLPNGQTISYLTQPREFFERPDRTYLLFLSYHATGDFYTGGAVWDVSDGVARPNTRLEQRRSAEGRSTLTGLTTEELGRALADRLATKP